MLYVTLPEEKTRKVSFYLAMEEYVARNITTDDCLFYWQVEPSVVFGRNQLIANEVNVDYCREHGISMFRRKSGGGCVYADMGNIMFSFITSNRNVGLAYNRYINMMILMLREMGADATATGRNDIMVDGKKVSGNSFYHIHGRSIVHGTMLYDTDMDNMANSITPSAGKLESKGINSVRQHITLLKDHIKIGIDDFKEYIKRNLCDGVIALNLADIDEIKRIENCVYLSPDFISGKNPRHKLTRQRRIEGVGDIEADIEVKGNTIKHVQLSGDFFALGDIDKLILERLKGVKLDKESIANALPERTENIILNLNKNDLINLLVGV